MYVCTLREPSRACRAYRDTIHLFDLAYDDDTLFIESHWNRFVQCARLLDAVLSEFGIDLSLAKTAWMMVSGCDRDNDAAPFPGARLLTIRGVPVPRTVPFRYLGSRVARRIGLAWGAYGHLKHVWTSRQLSRAVRASVLSSCVASVLLFGCESWTLRAWHWNRTWMAFVQGVSGVTWRQQRDQRLSADSLLQGCGLPSLHTMIYRKIARWLGRVSRQTPGVSGRTCPPSSEQSTRLLRSPRLASNAWGRYPCMALLALDGAAARLCSQNVYCHTYPTAASSSCPS